MKETKKLSNPKNILKSFLAGFLAFLLLFGDFGGVPGLSMEEAQGADRKLVGEMTLTGLKAPAISGQDMPSLDHLVLTAKDKSGNQIPNGEVYFTPPEWSPNDTKVEYNKAYTLKFTLRIKDSSKYAFDTVAFTQLSLPDTTNMSYRTYSGKTVNKIEVEVRFRKASGASSVCLQPSNDPDYDPYLKALYDPAAPVINSARVHINGASNDIDITETIKKGERSEAFPASSHYFLAMYLEGPEAIKYDVVRSLAGNSYPESPYSTGMWYIGDMGIYKIRPYLSEDAYSKYRIADMCGTSEEVIIKDLGGDKISVPVKASDGDPKTQSAYKITDDDKAKVVLVTTGGGAVLVGRKSKTGAPHQYIAPGTPTEIGTVEQWPSGTVSLRNPEEFTSKDNTVTLTVQGIDGTTGWTGGSNSVISHGSIAVSSGESIKVTYKDNTATIPNLTAITSLGTDIGISGLDHLVPYTDDVSYNVDGVYAIIKVDNDGENVFYYTYFGQDSANSTTGKTLEDLKKATRLSDLLNDPVEKVITNKTKAVDLSFETMVVINNENPIASSVEIPLGYTEWYWDEGAVDYKPMLVPEFEGAKATIAQGTKVSDIISGNAEVLISEPIPGLEDLKDFKGKGHLYQMNGWRRYDGAGSGVVKAPETRYKLGGFVSSESLWELYRQYEQWDNDPSKIKDIILAAEKGNGWNDGRLDLYYDIEEIPLIVGPIEEKDFHLVVNDKVKGGTVVTSPGAMEYETITTGAGISTIQTNFIWGLWNAITAKADRTEDSYYMDGDENVRVTVKVNNVTASRITNLAELKDVIFMADLLTEEEILKAFTMDTKDVTIEVTPEFQIDEWTVWKELTVKKPEVKETVTGGRLVNTTTGSGMTIAFDKAAAGSMIIDPFFSMVTGTDQYMAKPHAGYKLKEIRSDITVTYYDGTTESAGCTFDSLENFHGDREFIDYFDKTETGDRDYVKCLALVNPKNGRLPKEIATVITPVFEKYSQKEYQLRYNTDVGNWERDSYEPLEEKTGDEARNPDFYPSEIVGGEFTEVLALKDISIGTGTSIGYTFKGWRAYDTEGNCFEVPESKDIISIAGETVKKYEVPDLDSDLLLVADYDLEDVDYTYDPGTLSGPSITAKTFKASYMKRIALANPLDTKIGFEAASGMVFAGWKVKGVKDEGTADYQKYDGKIFTPGTMIPINSTNIVFEAQWLPKGTELKVKLVNSILEGENDFDYPDIEDIYVEGVKVGDEIDLSKIEKPKDTKKTKAYVFQYWSLSYNGAKPVDYRLTSVDTSAAEITLYAVYAGRQVKVAYSSKGVKKAQKLKSNVTGKVKVGTNKKAVYGEGFVPAQTGFAANGYVLDSYNTKANGKGVTVSLETPTELLVEKFGYKKGGKGTITLYPVFKPVTYLLHVYSVLPVSGAGLMVERADSAEATANAAAIVSPPAVTGSTGASLRYTVDENGNPDTYFAGYHYIYKWDITKVKSNKLDLGNIRVNTVEGSNGITFKSDSVWLGAAKTFCADGNSFKAYVGKTNRTRAKKKGKKTTYTTKVSVKEAIKASTIGTEDGAWQKDYPKTSYVLGWTAKANNIKLKFDADGGTLAPKPKTSEIRLTNKKQTQLRTMKTPAEGTCFRGWNVCGGEDVQFTGKQKIWADQIAYYVRLTDWDGTFTAVNVPETKTDVELIARSETISGGAVVSGSGISDMIWNDGTLTAKKKKGKSVINATLKSEGDKLAETLTKADQLPAGYSYKFVKWMNGAGKQVLGLTKKEGSTKLYGVFSLNKALKVSFAWKTAPDAAGTPARKGNKAVLSINPLTTMDKVYANVNKVTLKNYTLVGWSWKKNADAFLDDYYPIINKKLVINEDPAGFMEGAVNADVTASVDPILYPVWQPNKAPKVDFDFGSRDARVNGLPLDEYVNLAPYGAYVKTTEDKDHIIRTFKKGQPYAAYGVRIDSDGMLVTDHTVTRLGYTFEGWEELNVKTGKWTKITKPAQLTANGQAYRYLRVVWTRGTDSMRDK